MSSASKSKAGVPEAKFIEDVAQFVRDGILGTTVKEVMDQLQELYKKYQLMEKSFQAKKNKLNSRIPELVSALKIIRHLRSKEDSDEPIKTSFKLADNVYARGQITSTENVALWLGANVMLEYPIEEAETLLSKNLDSAKATLKETLVELDYLRDQITTTEVNIARVYNWDVQQNREKAPASEEDADQ